MMLSKKISRTSAMENFELCEESPTGLKWKAQNTRKDAKTRPGDPVGKYERWQRGQIPFASIRKMLKEVAADEVRLKRDDRIKKIQQAVEQNRKAADDEEKKRKKIISAINSRYGLSEDGLSLVVLRKGVSYSVGDVISTPYLSFCNNFIENSQVVNFLQTGEFPQVHYEMQDGECWQDVAAVLNKDFYEARNQARESDTIKELRQRIADLEAEVARLKGTNS
ncbi:hypothetical protein AAM37_gp60 [Pantoea phage vB_PagM_AAM37]|uniref:Uncharacterized protein n=1 Tax=Pantoea phage vB_PagM_AAM37 TaxID=2588093 RepID=A0A513ZYI5_9CAUD|nr:hypothetical protein HWC22_gp60 [Pantoea phage vB_PagM_AAM37]QDH45731.1 hypothetical protein AAM37_gp60 [Pantoea phage vB_PagM_AAM37]